jgi:acyl transferase domain-containing protein
VLRISATRLRSPFPFHNPLLAEASERLAQRLAALSQAPLTARVYSPILGRYYTDDDRITDLLAAHLTVPVPFTSALAVLRADGADTFVEAGVGSTLSRFVADSVADASAVACVDGAGDPVESFRRARSTLVTLGAAVPQPAAPVGAPADADAIAALLLPDVDEALRRSFWAARAQDLRGHARAVLRDYQAAQGHSSPVPSPSPAPSHAPHLRVVTLAEPAGDESEAVPPAISREGLLAELSGMYAAALEYPVEVFTEDVQLEADLGVDSVKQTELLSRAAERYRLSARPADFRLSEYSTMGKVADFVLAALPAPAAHAHAERIDPAPTSPGVELGAVPPAISREGLLAELSGMYAAALEYPVEVFTEDVQLEADLGVDSVKQTELLSRAAERYRLSARPADFRLSEYSTMGKVADFVLAALPALAA